MRTDDVARATGYSVQQVRDLERLGIVPPAERAANGYRQYRRHHVQAVRAYRGLAAAVGPVVARRTLAGLWEATLPDAAATITALHAGLAAERTSTLQALQALEAIAAEPAEGGPRDVLTITELAAALGVRTSALRHWEAEGLVEPERVGSLRARAYDVGAVRAARIVAALRAAGYPIPAVARTMAALRGLGDPSEAEAALRARLTGIATRSVALLRAGADLADVLDAAAP
ncbi:MerR family transcriptional regulator [Isoptericola sp. S6320L]|uniref:MerR family transcriptional regulator n=1 Tax=Isoptericola sp. S6320L TaxID=2926411 RepID=UPI001FF19CE2|nr:MerR family transcriptional regulator [Isoptericola sp. S6320L]MCK0116943.1 MerR family transcriptional regulator [Isoptericola sp. S6320L]